MESQPSGATFTLWVHLPDYKSPKEAVGYRGLILKQNGVSLADSLQPPPTGLTLQVTGLDANEGY